jgi:hypothetical protein
MWIKIALSAGVVLAAVAPQALHAPNAQPQPPTLQTQSPATAGGQTRFAAVCRGDQVLDSRPDPAWVRASFNNDHCQAPPVPAFINGGAASREEIVKAMIRAKNYAAAADTFQKCVSDFVAARRMDAAHGGGALTPSQVIIENHRILVSQRSKQTAAAQVRVAINAFNQYGSECPD